MIKQKLTTIECKWLDTTKVVRRLWPNFARKGYGLANICNVIDYNFCHHDALEDAKAAAYIMLIAIEESGLSLEFWLDRVQKPINISHRYSEQVKRKGNSNGELAGEVLTFTGSLNISRSDAADMAARVGCDVAAGVTKKTTVLIVGDQDLSLLAGHKKSSKHRKTEKLIEQGQNIRILGETQFLELVKL